VISAREALERLRAGNRRFAQDDRTQHSIANEARRRELADGQAPFAIILGCADSRVPAEIIFDQGLGTRRPTESQSRNLRSIVDRVRPSVEALLRTEHRHDEDALVREAVRANVRVSANQLRHGSDVLEQLIQAKGLVVVGAEYSLETGVVDFFDGA